MTELDQIICEAVAGIVAAVRSAGELPALPPETLIVAEHATALAVRPLLVAEVAGGSWLHPRLWRGELTLRLRVQPEAIAPEVAAAAHAAVAEWLDANPASLHDTLAALGLQLRRWQRRNAEDELDPAAPGRVYSQTWGLHVMRI